MDARSSSARDRLAVAVRSPRPLAAQTLFLVSTIAYKMSLTLLLHAGFDPLSLGAEPEALKWNQQAELIHGRWAMLGVAGCLVPELLTKAGVADLPVWSEAGKGVYYTDAVTLFLVQGLLMNWVELLRWQDIKTPGSVNADPIHNTTGFGMPYKLTSTEVGYPGSRFFDPLGMSADPKAFAVNKVKARPRAAPAREARPSLTRLAPRRRSRTAALRCAYPGVR